MTLSLVICFYNEERLLPLCFEGILNQTVYPDEIVLVNNASADRSLEIIKKFLPKFKIRKIKLIIIKENRKGIIFARKAGFALARSELIGTIDADTILSPHWVEEAKKYFFIHSQAVALCGPVSFYNASKLFRFYMKSVVFPVMSLLKIFSAMWSNNGVFRKAAYEKVNGLEGYDEMSKLFKLRYVYDDLFLSEKFKQIGLLKFLWRLEVHAEWRSNLGRIAEQTFQYLRIQKYVSNHTDSSGRIFKKPPKFQIFNQIYKRFSSK